MTDQKTLPQYLPQETINHIWENEEMEWKSRPNFKFRFTMFADNGKNEYEPGLQSLLGLVSAIALVLTYMFYTAARWLAMILTLLISSTIILLPDLFKYLRKRNTEYAFNKDGVFFKLWSWGTTRVHFIDFEDIDEIRYVEYEEKRGVLHFMSNKEFYFQTYDFATGKERFHPTFEMVENVVELKEKMEVYRQQKKHQLMAKK